MQVFGVKDSQGDRPSVSMVVTLLSFPRTVISWVKWNMQRNAMKSHDSQGDRPSVSTER